MPIAKTIKKTATKKAVPNEKAIDKFIHKAPASNAPEAVKKMGLVLSESEVKAINEIREKLYPAARNGKRLSVSIMEWVIMAVQEKIERDRDTLRGSN